MILPEHGGESVFQQDYLRGMQYNVYAKALFAPFGNQNHRKRQIRWWIEK